MIRETSNRKVVVGVGAALVAAGAIAYTVIASREAMLEVRSERQIAETRRRPDELGYFSFLNPNHRPAIYPAPAASCSAEALEHVRAAEAAAQAGDPSTGARAHLERALQVDPSCVGAGRLLLHLLSNEAFQVSARGFTEDARARPGDAAAQLLAAYYARGVGDAEGYRARLEAATAARPDQPLLHVAWSYYWVAFASPTSTENQLLELRAEVDTTGDVGAMAGLAVTYSQLHDDDAALYWCDRFYEALPESTHYGAAMTCVEVALRSRRPEVEARYLGRFWRSSSPRVGPECMHADLSFAYAQTCRLTEALAEADTAVAKGCERPGGGQRRRALLLLGRYGEASAPEGSQGYWGAGERQAHALALALSGRRDEGAKVASGLALGEERGTSASGTGQEDQMQEALFVLKTLLASGEPIDRLAAFAGCQVGPPTEADRLAGAAGGYTEALMPAEGRSRAEKALALDPRHAGAWANKIYALSVEQRLEEAAAEGERAMALEVAGGEFLANLGYVHEQRGDCARAVPLFRRARALLPLRAANYVNLAKCLDLLGQSAEADEAWRFVPGGRGTRAALWLFGALAAGVVLLYLGVKLALKKALPGRFGHLRFP